MPQFQVTVKQMKNSNGLRIEPGMSATVVTQSMSNPIQSSAGQQAIADAFMRIYGVDLKRIGAMSTVYIDVKQI